MDTIFATLIGPLGRTILQIAGTYLATRGIMDEGTYTAVTGAAITLITTGFTVYHNLKKPEVTAK